MYERDHYALALPLKPWFPPKRFGLLYFSFSVSPPTFFGISSHYALSKVQNNRGQYGIIESVEFLA